MWCGPLILVRPNLSYQREFLIRYIKIRNQYKRKSNSLTSVSRELLIENGEAIFEIYLDNEVFRGE